MKLIFNSATGNLEEDFPSTDALHSIKDRVMGQLKLDPSEADQYIVAFDGKTLDEEKTLSDLEIPDSATLILWRTGARRSGTRTWDRSNET